MRKIDQAIDVSFIYDLVKDLYCEDNGKSFIKKRLPTRGLSTV